MAGVSDWTQQFDLTNPYTTALGVDPWLSFNVQTDSGIYLLDQKGCTADFDVRSTKDDIPQRDGSILHERFLTGGVIAMSVQLWENEDTIACNEVVPAMLDPLLGALRSLLNAGDNEGRLAWDVLGGVGTDARRMFDDVRLLVYPRFSMEGPVPVVTFTLDTRFPYAITEAEEDPRPAFVNGVSQIITNRGTADYYPVFQVNRYLGVTQNVTVHNFTIYNLTTGMQFDYDDTLPGGPPIPALHYAEITCFGDTIYKDGDGANLKASVNELNSEYFALAVGENVIRIDGAPMDLLWAPAWG